MFMMEGSVVGKIIKLFIFVVLVGGLGGGCFYLWKQNSKLHQTIGQLRADNAYCEMQLQMLGMSSFEFRAYMEERCNDLERFYRDLPKRPDDDGVLDTNISSEEEAGSDASANREDTDPSKRGTTKSDSRGGNWLQRIKTWFETGFRS